MYRFRHLPVRLGGSYIRKNQHEHGRANVFNGRKHYLYGCF